MSYVFNENNFNATLPLVTNPKNKINSRSFNDKIMDNFVNQIKNNAIITLVNQIKSNAMANFANETKIGATASFVNETNCNKTALLDNKTKPNKVRWKLSEAPQQILRMLNNTNVTNISGNGLLINGGSNSSSMVTPHVNVRQSYKSTNVHLPPAQITSL